MKNSAKNSEIFSVKAQVNKQLHAMRKPYEHVRVGNVNVECVGVENVEHCVIGQFIGKIPSKTIEAENNYLSSFSR